MTRQQPPDWPERKPVSEMSAEEQREYAKELRAALRRELAELNRPKRERKLRRGLVKPRNRAEWEIFATDLLKDKPGSDQPDT
jgi:hypothetical protein